MRWKTGIWLVVAVATLGITAARQSSAEPPEASAETRSAPLRIPEAEKNRKNPIPSSEESVKHGSMLFASQCAMCHGKAGRGGGDMAKAIGVSVPDFKAPDRIGKRSDGELYYIITHGCGEMPADGERLDPNRRWDMVNAVRVMSRG